MKILGWGTLLLLIGLLTSCSPVAPLDFKKPGSLLLVEASQSQDSYNNIPPTSSAPIQVTPSSTPFLPLAATVMAFPPTATSTINPNLAQYGPGDVLIPILMYHHVLPYSNGSEYVVAVDQFRKQMQWLSDEGYQTVTISDMVTAIQHGKLLPKKSIILTFDDGYLDVYQNAVPILSQLGFIGNMYVIEKSLNTYGHLTDDIIFELAAAGWEFGSHSKTHAHLSSLNDLSDEVCLSRVRMSEKYNLPFDSFAYPFAAKDEKSIQAVKDCGYTSGAGNGSFTIQTEERLFFFSRREIKSYFDMQRFITTVTDLR